MVGWGWLVAKAGLPRLPSTLLHRSYGTVYESTQITNKLLDADTLYQLDKYSKYSPAPISIKHLLDHGKASDAKGSFNFLKREIPTRLANMIMELRLLPPDLLSQKECTEVLNDYITSFRDLVTYEGEKGDVLNRFNESLNMARRRHLGTVPMMATAVIKLRSINKSEGVSETVQYFLDRLYTNRISIHMLISHYNALLGEAQTLTGMVGTIDQKCNILDVTEHAYETASVLCDGEYFDHPRLEVSALDTSDDNTETQGQVTATYVPSHLHHILFEIFKNSMRATCEFSEKRGVAELPVVKCDIFKTKEDITIKISDQGGGISRREKRKVFNYMYSTAPYAAAEVSDGTSYGSLGLGDEALPMHGLGYGLPLSRLYARYFKGDIVMASVDGYGTDTYVYLQRLSHNAMENLPVFNSSSSNRLRSFETKVPDWTDNDRMKRE
jgi:pyruvate dehydrogenase kinase 2/3/4